MTPPDSSAGHLAMPLAASADASHFAAFDGSQLAHDRADVLGVGIAAVDMELSLGLADRWIRAGEPGYICLTGVHGVMEAQRDPGLRRILNHATMNLPDGMPMTWLGRLQGFKQMDRVFGPDFMAGMCRVSIERGYRNFIYGGKPGVAEHLSESLRQRFPGLQVVGTYTPPFRPLTPQEEESLLAQVAQSRPHIFWVGLSTPKQEWFMARFAPRLHVPLLIGVGAAFDFHTGRIRDCSTWIKRAGLQWLHRLAQDPRRLWKRYLRNNSAFIWQVTRQLLHRGATTWK